MGKSVEWINDRSFLLPAILYRRCLYKGISMKTILLTGSNGYIGRHVSQMLRRMGAKVIAVDRSVDKAIDVDEHIAADIFGSVDDVIDRLGFVPDVCLHLAWRDGFNHNSLAHIQDLSGHFDFLTGIQAAGVKQIAVMGSMHEVGYWEGAIDENTPCNPQSLYGVAKNALRQSLDLVFKNDDVVFQWIRGYYIYGDDENAQSIFGKLLRSAKEGKKTFPFTTGKNKYDFLPIEELARQISAVVMQDKVSGIINCCSGEPVSLSERIEGFIAENELDITLEYGTFPDRPYDSPGVWGDATKINMILQATSGEKVGV